MNLLNKGSRAGLGALQFLVSSLLRVPAFTIDLASYMLKNKSSPFAEAGKQNDSPLQTPLSDKFKDWSKSGISKIVTALDTTSNVRDVDVVKPNTSCAISAENISAKIPKEKIHTAKLSGNDSQRSNFR